MFSPSIAIVVLVALQPSEPAAATIAKVDGIFSRFDSTGLPGCTVGVARDGRTLLTRAYGMADLEHGVANRPDSIIEAGSVSKQFTAAAVLLLVQQGKVGLDDPARKYIKELPDYGTPLTVRHLLTHTSGLRDWGVLEGIAGWPRTTRAYTHDHVLDIVSRQRSLNFAPGSAYSYSNTGYNLAAILVSRVSGKSFPDFTRESIFEPLGMTRTSWRDDFTRVVADRSIAYDVTPGGISMDMPFENVFGNGGLLTTVSDLLKWNENAVNATVGGRSLIELQRDTMRLTSGAKIEYALGLRVSSWKGVPEVSHSGATAGYRAWLAQYPGNRNLSVAVLCNAANAAAPTLGHQVADLFLETAPPNSRAGDSAGAPEGWARPFVGLYVDERRNDVLSIEMDNGQVRATGLGPLTWISSDSLGVTGSAARIDVNRNAGGAVAGLRVIAGGETVPMRRVESARPSPAQLAAFAGEYVSDEVELSLRVTVEEGRLVIHRRPAATFPLSPTYADAFTSELGGIRFIRDAKGVVTEMSVTLDRVWDLRFRRAGRPPLT